jgi:LuxR family maltose regulon positive regulatory protein
VVGSLLETKLHVPRHPKGFVLRPQLRERLDAGAESALTLVSAAAGFGKTTLLAEWIATPTAGERLGGWLSLDERDNDPGRFWAYAIAALRTAVEGIGSEALSLLQPPQAPTEAVLGSLINELGRVGTDVVLVLDDFHVIEDQDVLEGVAFLLEHRPDQLHLVIATRSDPTLPVARLRAGGQLVEIRAADLRFTRELFAGNLGSDFVWQAATILGVLAVLLVAWASRKFARAVA